jgi:hypothetical protein
MDYDDKGAIAKKGNAITLTKLNAQTITKKNILNHWDLNL